MFAFFVSGEFKGYWHNQPGDKFFDVTCEVMLWPKSLTSLVYYPKMKESDLAESTPGLESLEIKGDDSKKIIADKFVISGMMLIPC
jgi:hypothetical protein